MSIRRPDALPSAPKYLKPATRNLFAQVVADYELDEHHLRLLTLAGEAWGPRPASPH
jgi:hypothetical protein